MTPRPLHVLAVVLLAAAVSARKYEILGQLESSAPDQTLPCSSTVGCEMECASMCDEGNGITLDDGSAGGCGAFYVKEGSCNLVSAATAGYNNATSTSLVACQSPCFINYYV